MTYILSLVASGSLADKLSTRFFHNGGHVQLRSNVPLKADTDSIIESECTSSWGRLLFIDSLIYRTRGSLSDRRGTFRLVWGCYRNSGVLTKSRQHIEVAVKRNSREEWPVLSSEGRGLAEEGWTPINHRESSRHCWISQSAFESVREKLLTEIHSTIKINLYRTRKLFPIESSILCKKQISIMLTKSNLLCIFSIFFQKTSWFWIRFNARTVLICSVHVIPA